MYKIKFDSDYPEDNTNSVDDKLPSEGWGPFRREWYSICSGHSINADGNYYLYDKSCNRCRAGKWLNCWMCVVDSFVHDNFYSVWFWWHNK